MTHDGSVGNGRLFTLSLCVQLVEEENVKAVLSYNEAYELKFFTNSKKVCVCISVI